MRTLVLVAAVATTLSSLPRAASASEQCETWTGWLTGNGRMALVLHVCANGGRLEGTMQMWGRGTGYSMRRFSGSRDAHGLTGLESGILLHRYRPGWWHCPVDRYDLRLVSEGELRGTFASRSCRDRGWLVLRRQAAP